MRRAKPQPRSTVAVDPKAYFRCLTSMLYGLSVRSSKRSLHSMLVHAVQVAEAWKQAAAEASAQEQRSYLALVQELRHPNHRGPRVGR